MATQVIEKTEAAPASLGQFPRQGEWTYEHWLHFPEDGWKYEIIDGVLYMTPPPAINHQRSSGELFRRMANYVRKHDLGELLAAPCGVRLPGQSVPLEPDILFVKKERLEIIKSQYVEGAPDLIVEVLSPSNAAYDRREKFKVYEQAGVAEYWLVDYQAKTVEIFIRQEEAYSRAGLYRAGQSAPSSQLSGFEIDVAAIFEF